MRWLLFLQFVIAAWAGCTTLPDAGAGCEALHSTLLSQMAGLRMDVMSRCPEGTFYNGPATIKYNEELAASSLDDVQKYVDEFVMTGVQPKGIGYSTAPVGMLAKIAGARESMLMGYDDTTQVIAELTMYWMKGGEKFPMGGSNQADCDGAGDSFAIADCKTWLKIVSSSVTDVGCGVAGGVISPSATMNVGVTVNAMVCKWSPAPSDNQTAIDCAPYPYCHLEPATPCSASCGGTGTQVWRAQPPSCSLPASEVRPCNLHPCSCTYSEWRPITPCSEPCIGAMASGFRQEARARLDGVSEHCTELTRTVDCSPMPCDKVGGLPPDALVNHVLENPANAPSLLAPGPNRPNFPAFLKGLPPEVPSAAVIKQLLSLPGLEPSVGPAVKNVDASRNPGAGSYMPNLHTPLMHYPNVLATSFTSQDVENVTVYGPCIRTASQTAVNRHCNVAAWASFKTASDVRAVFQCNTRKCHMDGISARTGESSRQLADGAQYVADSVCPLGTSCCEGVLQAVVCNRAPVSECVCNGERVPCPKCTTVGEAFGVVPEETLWTSTSISILVAVGVAALLVACSAIMIFIIALSRRCCGRRYDQECYDYEEYDDRGAGSYVYDGTVVDHQSGGSVMGGGPLSPGGFGSTPSRWVDADLPCDASEQYDPVMGEGPHFVHPRSGGM